MAQGFICEEAAIAGIQSTPALAAVITLSGRPDAVARDGFALARPAGGYWSHIDAQVLVTAGGNPSAAKIVLTWDAAGNDPAWLIPATDVTVEAALTTAATFLISARIDRWPRMPSSGTTGIVYAFLAITTGGSTVTLQKMRLHWRDGHSGG